MPSTAPQRISSPVPTAVRLNSNCFLFYTHQPFALGISHGFLRGYLSRPYSTCIAAVRHPSASNAILTSLPTGTGSKLLNVKIDGSVAIDAGDAVKESQDAHKIERIDVVGKNIVFPGISI
jgi:hypothetical protein